MHSNACVDGSVFAVKARFELLLFQIVIRCNALSSVCSSTLGFCMCREARCVLATVGALASPVVVLAVDMSTHRNTILARNTKPICA